jgi:hypothetical protein
MASASTWTSLNKIEFIPYGSTFSTFTFFLSFFFFFFWTGFFCDASAILELVLLNQVGLKLRDLPASVGWD